MKIRHILFSALLPALLILTGCSPRLTVRLASDDTVSMQFVSGTGEELTKTFTALTGQQIGRIDTSSAQKAMQKAGVSPNVITQLGPDLWLTTGPDSIDDILSGSPDTFDLAYSAGTPDGVFSITLSPETAQYIVSLLPEETASYTELFMAPLFTGEIMSAGEYTELIAAVYGQQLADELDESNFTLTVLVPGTATSVILPGKLNAVSETEGNSALINIPLSALLTLSDAQSILVFFDETKYTN